MAGPCDQPRVGDNAQKPNSLESPAIALSQTVWSSFEATSPGAKKPADSDKTNIVCTNPYGGQSETTDASTKQLVSSLPDSVNSGAVDKELAAFAKQHNGEDALTLAKNLNKELKAEGLSEQYNFAGDSNGKLTLRQIHTQKHSDLTAKADFYPNGAPAEVGPMADRAKVNDVAVRFANELSKSNDSAGDQIALDNLLNAMRQNHMDPVEVTGRINAALKPKTDFLLSSDSEGHVKLFHQKSTSQTETLSTAQV